MRGKRSDSTVVENEPGHAIEEVAGGWWWGGILDEKCDAVFSGKMLHLHESTVGDDFYEVEVRVEQGVVREVGSVTARRRSWGLGGTGQVTRRGKSEDE